MNNLTRFQTTSISRTFPNNLRLCIPRAVALDNQPFQILNTSSFSQPAAAPLVATVSAFHPPWPCPVVPPIVPTTPAVTGSFTAFCSGVVPVYGTIAAFKVPAKNASAITPAATVLLLSNLITEFFVSASRVCLVYEAANCTAFKHVDMPGLSNLGAGGTGLVTFWPPPHKSR